MSKVTVISIGALSAHSLRHERGDLRAAHATTTLIESEGRRILVDPSLPPSILVPRLDERAGIKADAITDVFLTDLRAMRRRGLVALDRAQVWAFERELQATLAFLQERLDEAEAADDAETTRAVEDEIELLGRIQVPDDAFAPKVDLFPLPGVTPGLCGLLVSMSHSSILVAGDAVATAEHLEQGTVLSPAFDVKQAQESLREAIEIADSIVAGRDNVLSNPLRGPFLRMR